MTKPKKFKITLDHDRATKNTVRFSEEHGGEVFDNTGTLSEGIVEPYMVGYIYVQKAALELIGNPTKIVATIEGVEYAAVEAEDGITDQEIADGSGVPVEA